MTFVFGLIIGVVAGLSIGVTVMALISINNDE